MRKNNINFPLPNNSQEPAIFYIPHPDDEAIGMAGSIRKQRQEGHPVYLVLLTNGRNEKTFQLLNGQKYCNIHNTYHHFHITMEQLMWLRKVEFIASARQLGVDKLFIINNGQGIEDLNVLQGAYKNVFIRTVQHTILKFHKMFPLAIHHFTSGPDDIFSHRNSPTETKVNAAHFACWKAAVSLSKYTFKKIFHRIYIYTWPLEKRISAVKVELDPKSVEIKDAALRQYQFFLPEADRFAIGYHSVPCLIEAALCDHHEYIDE